MATYNEYAQSNAIISQEIKELITKCLTTCNIIDNNAHIEYGSLNRNNLEEKSMCYVDGLRADLESSDIPISSDINLITSQFLNEMDEKILEFEELISYKKGLVQDVQTEISRVKNLIQIAEEAKSMPPKTDKAQVTPEQLRNAQLKLREMKVNLNSLITTLYPDVATRMIDVLALLLRNRTSGENNGYVEMDADQFHVVELLKDLGIIVTNPYNKIEIKMAE